MRIPDIPRHDFDLGNARRIIQPSPWINRVVLAQRHHVGTIFDQGLGQVGADEPIGACNENSFPIQQRLISMAHHMAWRNSAECSLGFRTS